MPSNNTVAWRLSWYWHEAESRVVGDHMVFYKKGVCFQYMCTKHHLSFNLLCKIYILGLAYFITMIERTRSHQADVTTNYPHWSWQITNYRFTEFLPHRSYNVMYWNSKKVSVLTVSKAAVSASPPPECQRRVPLPWEQYKELVRAGKSHWFHSFQQATFPTEWVYRPQ